jgi:hypothetical protein
MKFNMQKIGRVELEKSVDLVGGGAAKIQTGGDAQTGDITVVVPMDGGKAR